MTLEDLEHIFRFQTTVTEDFTPTGTLEYMLFDGQNKITGNCAVAELEKLVTTLDNFVFDGYRNRTPLFVKPEVHIAL
jgi:hypothetical protein